MQPNSKGNNYRILALKYYGSLLKDKLSEITSLVMLYTYEEFLIYAIRCSLRLLRCNNLQNCRYMSEISYYHFPLELKLSFPRLTNFFRYSDRKTLSLSCLYLTNKDETNINGSDVPRGDQEVPYARNIYRKTSHN